MLYTISPLISPLWLLLFNTCTFVTRMHVSRRLAPHLTYMALSSSGSFVTPMHVMQHFTPHLTSVALASSIHALS